MTPAESFRQLTSERQREVHFRLCEEALGAWSVYAAEHLAIRYTDSVVGMVHEVDVALPNDALRSARAGVDLATVQGRYVEPIIAIQDDDLQFPDPIEFAYYALYNCFRRYALGEEIDAWLIANQALSSIDDEGSWSQRLSAAVAAVS